MKTANFPRSVISGIYSDFPFPVTAEDWIISITDAEWFDAEIELSFDRILFMRFDDVEDDLEGSFSDAHAKTIADFIKEAREQKKNVWVNCHAGISRSGGVVEVLVRLGWEFIQSGKSCARIPNARVYNKIRVHFAELQQSWDEVVPNTDIWKGVEWN